MDEKQTRRAQREVVPVQAVSLFPFRQLRLNTCRELCLREAVRFRKDLLDKIRVVIFRRSSRLHVHEVERGSILHLVEFVSRLLSLSLGPAHAAPNSCPAAIVFPSCKQAAPTTRAATLELDLGFLVQEREG